MPRAELTGTIVPVVTPFAEDESFDDGAMRILLDFLLAEGADAIMPTAVTGEGLLLTVGELIAVWDAVLERVGGVCPLVPAVIATSTRLAVELVRAAEDRGAAAVMVAPIVPEVLPGRNQDDVFAFYSDIASASSLPLVLFNYPGLLGVDFTPTLVTRLSTIETVRYIKESSGDARRVHGIMRAAEGRVKVICGSPNTALESLALGCQAWITGAMNVVPRSARQLVRAVVVKGDLALGRRIYFEQILPVVDIVAASRNPTGTFKAGLSLRGVDVGHPRRPGLPLRDKDRARLAEVLEHVQAAESATELDLV